MAFRTWPTAEEKAESTGRTESGGANEQMAMEYAKEYPEYGTELPTIMRDPRWPAEDGWRKMEMEIYEVEIHYVRNVNTGEVADIKFKDRMD
jgi:hypothetical protein